MKAIKKPVVIDAFHATETNIADPRTWPVWLVTAWGQHVWAQGSSKSEPWRIRTSGVPVRVAVNDWVLRDAKGKIYSCKPDIFDMTYSLIGNGVDDIRTEAEFELFVYMKFDGVASLVDGFIEDAAPEVRFDVDFNGNGMISMAHDDSHRAYGSLFKFDEVAKLTKVVDLLVRSCLHSAKTIVLDSADPIEDQRAE